MVGGNQPTISFRILSFCLIRSDSITLSLDCPAVGGDASLVRGCVSGQCEERSHHVGPVRHRDSTGDRHQQPSTSPETSLGHSGNHVTDQPVGAAHLQNGACLLGRCVHTLTDFAVCAAFEHDTLTCTNDGSSSGPSSDLFILFHHSSLFPHASHL